MIEVYGGFSPNVVKVLLALEELGLAYRSIEVDLTKGAQFEPAFLAISPNNRIPAIVDLDPADGKGPLSVFESGAILYYLASKTGCLLSTDTRERAATMEWLMWQMAGQGPMLGQAGHFRNYAPEKIPYGISRYSREAARLYGVLDKRLADREFVAGAFSIADIACWPWIFFRNQHGIELSDYANVSRWYAMIESRPATIRVIADRTPPGPAELDADARRVLFQHSEE